MHYSTVPGFNTFAWSTHRDYCPICRMGPLPKHLILQRYRSHESQPLPQLSPWFNVLCCWEDQVPSHLGKLSSMGIAMGHPARMDRLLFTPGKGETIQSPLGFCRLAASQTCWNVLYLVEHVQLKDGRRCGITHPQCIFSWQCYLTQPTHMVCTTWSNVKFISF